jgi:hypothetical protein
MLPKKAVDKLTIERRIIAARQRQRLVDREAVRDRVVELWPTMSIRDIAIELDITVNGVIKDAELRGLPSRPIARQP